MKKLYFILALIITALFLISPFVQALTPEENSTIMKLHKINVLERYRTDQEWNMPLRAIDTVSMGIKGMSVLKQDYEDQFKIAQKDLEENFFRINNRLEWLESRSMEAHFNANELKRMKKRVDDLEFTQVVGGVLLLFSFLL